MVPLTTGDLRDTTVGRMRVLFASGIDGFCHRYAVLHWAEQLATPMLRRFLVAR